MIERKDSAANLKELTLAQQLLSETVLAIMNFYNSRKESKTVSVIPVAGRVTLLGTVSGISKVSVTNVGNLNIKQSNLEIYFKFSNERQSDVTVTHDKSS